jgi:hypothetical protein
VPAAHQFGREVRTDEPGAAGDEVVGHASTLAITVHTRTQFGEPVGAPGFTTFRACFRSFH